MPTSYTPSPTVFHATLTEVSDGDPFAASALNPPVESVADNAAYLKARQDSGFVRSVADLAALKALTDHQNGRVCLVRSTGVVYGFTTDETRPIGSPPVEPLQVAANDDTAGATGFWRALEGIAGIAKGLATLDTSGKLTSAQRGGWVVTTRFVDGIGGSTNNASSYDSAAPTLSIPGVQIGDIITVRASLIFTIGNASAHIWTFAGLNDGLTDVASTQVLSSNATTAAAYAPELVFTAARAATHVASVRFKTDNATYAATIIAGSLSAQVVRP